MIDDMDIDCGCILSGASMHEVADQIFRSVLAVASGEKTKSECQGYGNHEFVPWQLGAVL
jgi:altronate hydrolase